MPHRESADATTLMRELTDRRGNHVRENRGERVSLFAPLRRLRRSLFGNHH